MLTTTTKPIALQTLTPRVAGSLFTKRILASLLFLFVVAHANTVSAQKIWRGSNFNHTSETTFTQIFLTLWASNTRAIGTNDWYPPEEYYEAIDAGPGWVFLYQPDLNRYFYLTEDEGSVYDDLQGVWTNDLCGTFIETANAYSVTMKQLHVIDDREIGDGKWTLQIDYNGTWTRLLSNHSAGSGRRIAFDRGPYRYSAREFTLQAWLYEYDGPPFGSGYDFVGSPSVRVTQTGEYSLRYNNSEGIVTVYFLVKRAP